MDQFQPQNIITSNKSYIKRNWPILVLVFLLLLSSFAAGFGSGFLTGQKKLSTLNIFQQPKTEPNDSKSLTGTISSISGNTLNIINGVAAIGSSPLQANMSGNYQIEITSDTNISKVGGPIQAGELSAKTSRISIEDLKPGMLVKIETSEPISSSPLKAVAIEAQPAVQSQESNSAPPSLPSPLPPTDITTIRTTATQSARPNNQ